MKIWEWEGGLRSRLVLLVLIALVPVFALFVWTAAKNEAAALDLAQANLQSEALQAAAREQRLLDRVNQLLSDVAAGPSIRNPALNLCTRYLQNLRAQDAAYTNLGVISLDGRVACHAENSGKEIILSDRRYFQEVIATRKFSIGEIAVGRASGKTSIGFAAPVYDDQNVLNGVAFVALGIDAISTALASAPSTNGAQFRLLDRTGTILASFPAGKELRGTRERDPVILAALRAQGTGVHEDANSDEQVYAFAQVGGNNDSGMSVVVTVPREVIAAGPRNAMSLDMLALLCVTIFGALCASAIADRAIVGPAEAILHAADEITVGNLDARVPPGATHGGEFGQIGQSLNRLAEAVQARDLQVETSLQREAKERVILDRVVNSMSEGVIACDMNGTLTLFNAAAGRLYTPMSPGARLDEWRNKSDLLTLDGQILFSLDERPMALALRGINTDNREFLVRRAGRRDNIYRISARPLLDSVTSEIMGAVMVFSDITEAKENAGFIDGQNDVLTLIAGGVPLQQALDAIVKLVERRARGSLCSILLVKEGVLRHGATAGLPGSFVRLIDGLPVAEGSGACGTAVHRNQAVFVENIATDPLMKDFRDVAQAYDLQACWSMPVVSIDGHVLATFAVYHHQPAAPEPKDLELLDTATRLARIALERHRVEAALLSGEARFRELAENIQDVFYNVDAKTGKVLYISPGYERVWGRSCESLYDDPRSYAAVVLPQDKTVIRRAWNQNRLGVASVGEYRILSGNGSIRWIRDSAYPVRGADGELERVVGTALDITDRKQAELALTSTNRALQMLSSQGNAINRIDEEHELLSAICQVAIDAGGYTLAWIGYARDDDRRTIEIMTHAGHEDGYLVPGSVSWHADRRSGQGPAGRAIRAGHSVQSGDIASESVEFPWREPALQRGYRSAICLPLKDGAHSFGVLCLYAGEVQQFSEGEVRLLQEFADNLAFGIDSLRTRVESQHNQEARRLADTHMREQASLLDRAQDAIMVRNLDRTIRYWNKGAERLYGWSAEEVLGKTMDTEMYRSAADLQRAMGHTLANNGDWAGELEQVDRHGVAVCVEARWTVVRDEQGVVNGVLGINTDIRERKQAREQIMELNATLEERVQKRTAQLEFANQQLEAFSYSVSHDLRTPLSSVDGFSNLLAKNLSAMQDNHPLAEKNRHYLSRIRGGVSRMGELIDAMLGLAHVSRSSLRWEPVDLSELARAVMAGFQEREPSRAAELTVQPGLQAHGDPRLLNQVLDNLLGNAWKFSGGRDCCRIVFGSQTGPGGETVYFVRDNGAGFDMNYADKLFGAFQRLHSASEFAGTGIGLATVHRIIARHGGKVWAESAPDQGSTFFFTLGAAAAL
jgi:PAS domain S-box-containing protein